MSQQLTIVDTDTRIGAVKEQAHGSIVLAATGSALTFTWLIHLIDWTPLGFGIHGVCGVVGGYLIGSGVARAALGVRKSRGNLIAVSGKNRVVASTLRIAVGAAFIGASYLWAIAPTFSFATLAAIPPAVWIVAVTVALSMSPAIFRVAR